MTISDTQLVDAYATIQVSLVILSMWLAYYAGSHPRDPKTQRFTRKRNLAYYGSWIAAILGVLLPVINAVKTNRDDDLESSTHDVVKQIQSAGAEAQETLDRVNDSSEKALGLSNRILGNSMVALAKVNAANELAKTANGQLSRVSGSVDVIGKNVDLLNGQIHEQSLDLTKTAVGTRDLLNPLDITSVSFTQFVRVPKIDEFAPYCEWAKREAASLLRNGQARGENYAIYVGQGSPDVPVELRITGPCDLLPIQSTDKSTELASLVLLHPRFGIDFYASDPGYATNVRPAAVFHTSRPEDLDLNVDDLERYLRACQENIVITWDGTETATICLEVDHLPLVGAAYEPVASISELDNSYYRIVFQVPLGDPRSRKGTIIAGPIELTLSPTGINWNLYYPPEIYTRYDPKSHAWLTPAIRLTAKDLPYEY